MWNTLFESAPLLFPLLLFMLRFVAPIPWGSGANPQSRRNLPAYPLVSDRDQPHARQQ